MSSPEFNGLGTRTVTRIASALNEDDDPVRPLVALGTDWALGTCGTLRACGTLRTGSPLRPLRTDGAGRTLRSCRSSGAGCAGFTGRALRPDRARRSVRSSGACRSGNARFTRGSLRSRHSWQALRTCWSGGAGRTLHAGRSLWTRWSHRPNGTGHTGRAYGALRTHGTGSACRARGSSEALRPSRALRPHRTLRAGGPGGATASDRHAHCELRVIRETDADEVRANRKVPRQRDSDGPASNIQGTDRHRLIGQPDPRYAGTQTVQTNDQVAAHYAGLQNPLRPLVALSVGEAGSPERGDRDKGAPRREAPRPG